MPIRGRVNGRPAARLPAASCRNHSGLKRAILIQLTQNPSATDLEICRGLVADGLAELPPGWNVNRRDRLFVRAYSGNRGVRRKIEITIGKVRADLREAGLLPHR